VLWSAAITSVVGSAFTSVSFMKTLHRSISEKPRYFIIAFIVLSTIVFIRVGRPVNVLIFAGALNGLILPIALSLILVASMNREIMGGYRHPYWMMGAGWFGSGCHGIHGRSRNNKFVLSCHIAGLPLHLRLYKFLT
jgi:Mn2+/Fe2+ NRAMP family transporter